MITAKTALLAVIGDPVAHSLSPVMHNGWFADHGLDAAYVAMRLQSDDPVVAIKALAGFGLKGANVTVPHKEAAAQAADRSEQAVANTLRWEADGTLSAFNTDGAGFLDALTEAAPGWRAGVKRALILGAGGAAHGIAEALQRSCQLTIANRTRSRAEALAAAVNARCEPWQNLAAAFANADLIINATSVGLSGAPFDWPVANAKKTAIVADIVYRPLETPLLAAARARGLATMDGLGMLIHQGARAFEIWWGVRPSAAKARERLEAALR